MVDNQESNSEQVQTSYEKANAVFYGKVVEVKRESVKDESRTVSYEYLRVKFKVESSWKGQTTSEVFVRTAGDSAACGFAFEAGKRYLVYANDTGNGLQTTICTRTAAGSTDAKYLNKVKKPKEILKSPKEKI
jgi:hypothetical protein